MLHAAGESSPGNLPPHTHAIALACRDEAELLHYAEKLDLHGIPYNLIREPDPPYHGAATALGIPPMPRSALRKLLSKLPLIKE